MKLFFPQEIIVELNPVVSTPALRALLKVRSADEYAGILGTRGKISISAQIRREKLKKSFLELWLNNLLLRYCYYKRNLALRLQMPCERPRLPKSQIVAPPLPCAMMRVFLAMQNRPKESQGCPLPHGERPGLLCRKQIFARCASQNVYL